jgi:hypothetical protein
MIAAITPCGDQGIPRLVYLEDSEDDSVVMN